MATSLAVNDILSVRAWNSCAEQAAVNTYNFQVVSVTGGAITDQDFADTIEPVMATFYKGYMASSASFDGVQVYIVFRAGPLPRPVSNTLNAGASGGGPNSVPRNTAAIMKYSGVFRGPSLQGRVYLPFVTTAAVTVIGDQSASLVTQINAFATQLKTPIIVTIGANSATLVWGILHRHPKPAPPTINQIIEAASNGKFGQMHKRGDYGRANQSPI